MKNTFALFSLMLLAVSSVAIDAGFSLDDILLVSSLLIAAAKRGDLSEIEKLIDGGEAVDQTDKYGQTALIHAAMSDKSDAVELLIKYKTNVNYATPNDGYTALIKAALHNNSDIVKVLIRQGAHVNTTDNIKHTALMHAALKDQSNAAEALLCYDANGGKDLMYAVVRNTEYLSTVAIKLLNYNVNVNYQDEHGNTVLMKAAENGQIDVMKELFKKKADLSTTNNEGKNAWDYAKDEQTREILNKYKYS